jgi:alcohol dehydrogenase class IV
MNATAAPRANYNYPTAYRLGCGRRSELAVACVEMGMEKPLVVADPVVAGLGWFGELVASLGAGTETFSRIQGNPVEQNVIDGVAAYRDGKHDGCVLIGGGSALDVGKAIALMVDHPGSVFDYEDVGDNWTRVDGDRIARMIALPTTSGTGSEVGRSSVIVDERDHSKKIIFHPKMLPPLVIADPETTFDLPPAMTAFTGLDAFVHSFEAFCAPGYHPMADGIALEGMRLVQENLVRCYQDGHDVEARTHMMLASSMGATAFQKGLGLVHAMTHPLGAATDVHHGLANAILLPYVMVHNRPAIEKAMGRLASHLRLGGEGFSAVLGWVLDLRQRVGVPPTLGAVSGMTPALCEELAPRALVDPSLGTNPRECTAAEIADVYRRALSGDLGA